MAISGWGVFLIVLVLILIFGGGGYVLCVYRDCRIDHTPSLTALKLHPLSSQKIGAATTKPEPFQQKTTRTGGAYESSGGAGYGGGARGATGRTAFGPLDPDEAWDARVDHETSGYYEEQELGLQDPGHGPYGGGGYGEVGIGGIEEGRGRSRSRQRELDNRYDEEVHGKPRSDPFGDGAEPSNMSLRAVSPRPHETSGGTRGVHSHRKGQSSLGTMGSAENSPTERRSMFHEEM
nr:hypothetical protein CFP56_21784 [Quercus suber]